MKVRNLVCALGAALATTPISFFASAAAAERSGASALVMPFDATAGSVSFLSVSHRGAPEAKALRTHWAFWSDACEPLVDVDVCLPPDGGIVVDPAAVPRTDATADLSGRRGFATVTAYRGGGACGDAGDDERLAGGSLFGTFTLASIASGAAFGGAAIGVPVDPTGSFVDLPGAADTHQSALHVPSFAPATLDVSRVVLLALRERRGAGGGRSVELGPAGSAAAPVHASVSFADHSGSRVALPDVRFGCALFGSLHAGDPDSLLAADAEVEIGTGGVLEITEPQLDERPLGETARLFGFHGQALGTFGVLAVAEPIDSAESEPSPGPTPSPTGGATRTPPPAPTSASTPILPPTPSPSASASGPTPVSSATPTGPAKTPTPRPGATSTPSPIRPTPTPARTSAHPTPTPGPGSTPTPAPSAIATTTPASSPTATRTPAPTRTAAPACETVTVEIRTQYGASPASVAGVAATLTYGAAGVALPGSGSVASVMARVTNVSGVNGLFQVADRDGRGSGDDLRIGLVAIATPIPQGPLARVRFDCASGTTPPPSAFACALDASTLGGDLLPGPSCTAEILP